MRFSLTRLAGQSQPILLVCLLLIFFLFLEWKHPFYFLQDDNRSYALPMFVHNYRSLIVDHELAFFNFHQYLGTPHFSTAQSAVLYPLVYAGIFMSDLLFGHPLAAIDMVTIFHLVLAGLGFFYFLKYLKIESKSAFLTALAWPLVSFIIFLANSWWWVSGLAAYFPLVLLFALKVYREPFSYKNIFLLGLFRSLIFLVGYVQFFLYALIFEFLTVTGLVIYQAVSDRHSLKEWWLRLKFYGISYLVMLIFILPVLLPTIRQMQFSDARNSALPWSQYADHDYEIGEWLRGLFQPFSSLPNEPVVGNDSFNQIIPSLSHIGYTALLGLFLTFGYFFSQRKKQWGAFFHSLFFVCLALAIIAFLWSSNSIFQLFIYGLPILNRFRWPFKLQFFTALYLLILSALGLQVFFRLWTGKRLIPIAVTIFILSNFAVLYLSGPYRSLYRFPEHGPVYEPPPLTDMYQGRILSVDDDRADNTDNLDTGYFAENYATYWGLYHLAGYEPFLSKKNTEKTLGLNHLKLFTSDDQSFPLDYFREWGVRWYIVGQEKSRYDSFFTQRGLQKVMEGNGRSIYSDVLSKPFVFWMGDGTENNITSTVNSNTITVSTDNTRDDQLVINFLFHPFFQARVSDKDVPVGFDSEDRMVIPVPAGHQDIVIRYSDPYFRLAWYISGFLMILIFIFSRKGENFPKKIF